MSCSVCGQNFERKDKGCQQQECGQCKQKYHRFCYGYNNTDGICDPCQDGAKKSSCCVCGQKGLLRRLSDQSGVYVHVSCALFAPHIQVINYHSMTFATKSQIDKKTKEKCSNCGKSGASIQCLDCQAFAHPHCIYIEQVEKAQEDIETEQWIFHLKFQATEQDPNLLNITQSDIKSELRNIHEAFSIAIDKFQDKSKKKQQNQNVKETIKNTLDCIFENFQIPQGNQQQWSSDDKIESYCQVHMENRRLFCVCRKSLNNKQMVQCDYCQEWYHFACIKRKSVKDDSYICEGCKIWSAKRIKIDLEDPKLLNFEELVVPKGVYILHLIDLLPIILYIESLMKRLPNIPLTLLDYRNLKFYKLFLASLPIKPSTVIELDKILLKENFQEELKQRMQSIIPQQLEFNEQFAEELVKQFKNKGYFFEMENKLIKSYVISTKELKQQIQSGIEEGYLKEDCFKLLKDGMIENAKIFKSPSETLQLCVNKFKIAQQLKTQFKSLFQTEQMIMEQPQLENQLELTVYKQQILLKTQKNKPHQDRLKEIKKKAHLNNITFSCLGVIDDLFQQLNELVQENIQQSYRKVQEFPITNDILNTNLQNYFEQEFIDEFKVELELKIENNQPLSIKEYTTLYTFENIQKAAKDSVVIRTVYNQLNEIHQKCQSHKKLTIINCNEILELIQKCTLTTQYIETQKAKLLKFQELHQQIHKSITLDQLDDIEHQCFQLGFDLDVQSRRQQLEEAQQILQNYQPKLNHPIQEYKQLKSLELDNIVKEIEKQQDFIKQLYYMNYNYYDLPQKMLQKVKEITEVDCTNELLYNITIPEVVYEELQQVVINFKQLKWKSECQLILDVGQPNKYDMAQIIKLLNSENSIQDPFYQSQLQQIKKEYEEWLIQLKEFESQLSGPNIPQFNQLIKLINKNHYQDSNQQSKLWQYYIQMLWMQKAEEFIEAKATPAAYKTLISSSNYANIDPNNRLLLQLKQQVNIMDDLSKKLREYQEQRHLWLKSREQSNNLQSYKSYYKYLENKPDAELINQIYLLAKEYPVFKVKDMAEDLQEVRQVLQQYNELVQKQPDNSQFIQQLLKIRAYYCCCFLKVKNFCVQLMYNLIKQQSLKCLKQLNPTDQILQRLDEINLLVLLGGDEWYSKLSLTYKGRQDNTNSADFKFIDCSLTDDFEWIRWMEESSQNINENFGIDNKKGYKEQKIKKKKQQVQKVVEGITEDLRQTQRNEIIQLFKKQQQWKNVSEQQVRNLEAQIFMEQSFDKDKYLKEVEKVKFVLKQNKQIELSYEEFKKTYKQLLQQKKSSQQQTNGTQSLQLESVKVIKKQPPPQPQKIVQQYQQQQQQQQQTLKEREVEKKIKPENQIQPIIIPQPIISTNKVLLYNPDGQIELPEKKIKNQLMSIGEINLQIKRKVNDQREIIIIKPQLLTYDHHLAHFFPKTENIQLTCETFSPVKEVMDYFTQRKPGQFKMIIGWLYSSNLQVAGDLYRLAEKLKHSKQCVGVKLGEFGMTLIYHDYLNKLKPTTKWIIFKDQLDNQQTMNSLQKYHNLEKFKPHLCFVYYLKDIKEQTNPIISEVIDYVNVLKQPIFKKVIDAQKQQIKKQKKKDLEPISDEENGNGLQKEDVHTMMMEIPNILSLLNQ